MLTFMHFTVGTLFAIRKKPSLDLFLAAGFFAVCADFDLILNWLGLNFWWFTHRAITHSLIFSVILGIIALWLYRSFWLGFLPHLSHLILDVLDAGTKIMVLPGIFMQYTLPINRAILSGVTGSAILLFWIIYVNHKKNGAEKETDMRLL